MSTQEALRRKMLNHRAVMTDNELNSHSDIIANKLLDLKLIQNSHHIAVYYAMRGEVDLTKLIHTLWQRSHKLYLPVIQDDDPSMQFAAYPNEHCLKENKFKIMQPVNTDLIALEALEVVIVPVVAFDNSLNRIGMGGGYYDRAFKNKQKNSAPFLLGVAHAFQKIDKIPTQPWDIRLDGLITERENYGLL